VDAAYIEVIPMTRISCFTPALALLMGVAVFSYTSAALAEPEFKLRGRMHLDYALHDDDQIDLDDGFLFRRTRIGVKGSLNDEWSGMIEYDFSENNTSAQDIYVQRSLSSGGSIRIGHIKVPMGMEEISSTNYLPFIERSSPNTALVTSYRIGVGYQRFAGALGFQAMAFGRELEDNRPGDDPVGIGARAIYAPVFDGNQLHLAASFAYEDARDFNTVRFRDRPESRPDGKRLVDTGTIAGVDKVIKYGIEAAWQSGPFIAQAEYLAAGVDRDAGPEPDFSGWYLQGNWIVTGERRGYRDGVFRNVKPGSPDRGAWELSVRYSSLDLNDSGFQGGEQDNVTVGLNYYTQANVRFMLNYVMVDVSDSGATIDGETVGDESPNILVGRVQYFF